MVMYSPGSTREMLRHMAGFVRRAVTGKLTDDEEMCRQMFVPEMNSRASRRHVKQTRVWGHGYSYDDPTLGAQDNHEFYRRIQPS